MREVDHHSATEPEGGEQNALPTGSTAECGVTEGVNVALGVAHDDAG